MAAPVLQWSETNGASGAPTVTDGITAINFAAVDQASNTANLLTNNPIPAGSNSFEKYNRVKVTTAATNSLSAFSVYFSATAPTDGGGTASTLTMKYGTPGAYATPASAASTVATTACSATTAAPGATITAPANTVGSYSGYVCQQLQVAANATGGNCTFPAAWLTLQYTYS